MLAIGDQAGDRAVGTILFGSETLPTTTIAATTTDRCPTTTAGHHHDLRSDRPRATTTGHHDHDDDLTHEHATATQVSAGRSYSRRLGDGQRHRDRAGHGDTREPYRERELLCLSDRDRPDHRAWSVRATTGAHLATAI